MLFVQILDQELESENLSWVAEIYVFQKQFVQNLSSKITVQVSCCFFVWQILSRKERNLVLAQCNPTVMVMF